MIYIPGSQASAPSSHVLTCSPSIPSHSYKLKLIHSSTYKFLPYTMASEDANDQLLHFLLCPLMAQGHTIPMIDIAKLIAKQNHIVTIITTPLNAVRFKPLIDRATETGLDIRINQLKFGYSYDPKEALADGCENVDMLPSLSLVRDFITSTSKLQEPLEQVFEELNPRPNCIISDAALPWTLDVAQKFNIPRIVFHGFGCFCLLCMNILRKTKVHEKLASDADSFVVPELPDRIEVTRGQVPSLRQPSKDEIRAQLRARMIEAEEKSFGVVVNTFEELEPEYVKGYRRAKGEQKIWCIGPVSLCNENSSDKAKRGNTASIDENQCRKWLDSRDHGTVVYACLGSLCNLSVLQLKEIGLGLEASKQPFIWVIRGGRNLEDLEKWITEDGFEERTEGTGLVIRGWAPQLLILSHAAVGGFLTHCGWNSTLEGISAGLPLMTWPMFADQFLNEKLVDQVLGIGVRVGANVDTWEEENVGVVVGKEDVMTAVEKLMDFDGDEGKTRRERARKLGEVARRAAEEGGSSHLNLKALVQDIKDQVNTKQ